MKWVLIEKPELRDAYVSGKINEELKAVYDEVNRTFDEFAKDKIVIYG